MRAPPPVRPPPLAPGDLVAVVAPAGPVPAEALDAGLAWLASRYRVWVDEGVRARTGYLAGDDATRLAGLGRALALPDARAIVCARGGYGCLRLLSELDLGALARAPRWLVGFSDVTVLHAEASRAGVGSIHGPNVSQLGHEPGPGLHDALVSALEAETWAPRWDGLDALAAGQAEGTAFGGNLALLVALAAAGRLVVPEGAVLLLEDVGEAPYRIDRALTALRLGGHLARAAALVFGGFTSCRPAPDGATVEDVLAELAARLGCPVVAGAPFGHQADNRALRLGAHVAVHAPARGQGRASVVFAG